MHRVRFALIAVHYSQRLQIHSLVRVVPVCCFDPCPGVRHASTRATCTPSAIWRLQHDNVRMLANVLACMQALQCLMPRLPTHATPLHMRDMRP